MGVEFNMGPPPYLLEYILRDARGRTADDCRITLGPLDMSQFIPGMRVARVADPEGNIVELNQGYVDEVGPPPPPPLDIP